MANVITLDNDIKELDDFRYKALVEVYGKEKADELRNPTGDDEFFDDDVQEILDEVNEDGEETLAD